MAIRNLTQYAVLVESDQIPVNSEDAGGDVRVALSVLAAYLQSLLTVTGPLLHQHESPTATGFVVTVDPVGEGGEAGDYVWVVLTPSAGYAAGSILLPAFGEAVDGQEVLVNCTQAVTALTVSATGLTVAGAPTTLAANAFFRMKYDGVGFKWFRVG